MRGKGRQEAILLQYFHYFAHALAALFLWSHTAVFGLLQYVDHTLTIEYVTQWIAMLLEDAHDGGNNQTLYRRKIKLFQQLLHLSSTSLLEKMIQMRRRGA